MTVSNDSQSQNSFSRARKSRDARFDGVFFTAVKTTGIYCRPICPANPPLEKNVEYHRSAFSAAQAGFRPCLRCRPECAPRSAAWQGTGTTLQRAIKLIEAGALYDNSVDDLAARVGVSSRYLRELFARGLGVSPKQYAIYQQCLFAKQLLHQSQLAISDIAMASGFNSVRRFNEAVKQHLGLSPREIRSGRSNSQQGLVLFLAYRPPFAWQEMLNFLRRRLIDGLEWADETSYGRVIEYGQSRGTIEVSHDDEKASLRISLKLNRIDDLLGIQNRLRALFDVDADIDAIDSHLQAELSDAIDYLPGLRIPGIWSVFEAGVRAILGQQVSVVAAQKLVQTLVDELGVPLAQQTPESSKILRCFPSAKAVGESDLSFFKMPQARKDCLRRFANHFVNAAEPENIDEWLKLKGIGPWTANYARIRGSKDPDVWLAGDAGVNNALKRVGDLDDLTRLAPWRSYLTFQLWNQL